VVKESSDQLWRRVTGSTLKAMAKKRTLGFHYGNGQSRPGSGEVGLPPSLLVKTPEMVAVFRGKADAEAMKLCYQDANIHQHYRPKGDLPGRLFDTLEQYRCELLGAKRFKGVSHNLQASLDYSFREKGYHRLNEKAYREKANDLIPDAFCFLVREIISGLPLSASIDKFVGHFRNFFDDHIYALIADLKSCIGNQENFAIGVNRIFRALALVDVGGESDISLNERSPNAQLLSVFSSEFTMPEAADEEKMQLLAKLDASSDGDNLESISQSLLPALESNDYNEIPHASQANGQISIFSGNRQQSAYKPFTTAFDRVLTVNDLCTSDELDHLWLQLSKQLSRLHTVVSRLANRLQRKLMAQQTRHWEFEQEEGILDAARLSQVIVDPIQPLSFKIDADSSFVDTQVTLLIDNSASMRGYPIMVAAVTVDILARTLERCGVKVEILGFTTADFKGGQSAQYWHQQGKPANPGRLNDIRHIIYKNADTPLRHARKGLALMLRDDFLKQNIDGEALLWAHQRLLARQEQRRILVVISDGAPLEETTLAANRGNILDRHLRDVITFIENRSDVELTAIGIGHDVKSYYRSAISINDPAELGSTMVEGLIKLFDKRVKSTNPK